MNGLFVALGGGIGALLRYLLSLIPYENEFPLLTFVTNILGACLIGFFVGFGVGKMEKKWELFLKTGICGGFTTFSTFSLEALTLIEKGKYLLGVSYMVLSILLCVIGVVVGRYLGEMLKIN